jgi:hypothetical protein
VETIAYGNSLTSSFAGQRPQNIVAIPSSPLTGFGVPHEIQRRHLAHKVTLSITSGVVPDEDFGTSLSMSFSSDAQPRGISVTIWL